MGHNVEKNFMDIGYLLLMFIPLLFLWRARGRKNRIILGALLVLMWFLSVGSSHVLSEKGEKLRGDRIESYIENSGDHGLRKSIAKVYLLIGKVYAPVGHALDNITGDGDQLTYPLLIALIYLLYFIYARHSSKKETDFYVGALLLFYCFFMLILSAGIIWYGFLMFPLLFLEISRYAGLSATYKRYLLIAGFIFVFLSYFLKLSSLYVRSDVGMGMIQPPVLAYNFSNAKGNVVYEGYFRNIGTALDKINAEDKSLIYQAGTSLSFLIRNNNNRVYKDGILNIHSQLVDKYKYQGAVNTVLKASGFKYLIVSPNLYNMDNTPEKSLTAKYQKMLGYLYQNKGLKLLATDRYMKKINEDGSYVYEYDMFGDEVMQQGSYVIYELE
jgi:hypothetical protein